MRSITSRSKGTQNVSLIGVLSFAARISLWGSDFYQVKAGPEPDHLVPTHVSDEYDSRIAKYLFVTDGNFGRMVVLPSFESEFCLSVHADISDASVKKHDGWWMVPDEEKAYIITVTSTSESIWASIPQKGEKKRKTNIRISRVHKKISLDLAVAIQRVWGKALHLTRYPSAARNGVDGTTCQFSVWVRGLGNLEGETWSPEGGLPRELVDIGTDLIAFASQDAKGKELTEKVLIQKLKKLESKIPKA